LQWRERRPFHIAKISAQAFYMRQRASASSRVAAFWQSMGGSRE